MIRKILFGFLAGLHLALLQFSYFFLLLINVTSTYVTYATIVVSWMAGALAGLMIPRLHAWVATGVGVVSYYVVYALVINNPLASFTLWVSALGVFLSGIWAGHFFVLMLPAFARADQLFLHENNGFLLGVIGVFVGFTLSGMQFLLWAPAVSFVVLLLSYAITQLGNESEEASPDTAG